MPMRWQTVQLPLALGMTQKTDPRALQPPALAIVNDATFDVAGGLQPRAPYLGQVSNQYLIPGGGGSTGTLPAVRRFVTNGDELVAFTKDRLYSFSAISGYWIDKGEHPAVAVDETPVFETTSDQTQCDRAELADVYIYVWRDEANPTAGGAGPALGVGGHPPAANGGSVYIAAVDRETGTVVLAPTEIPGEARPRLVVLTGSAVAYLLTINASSGNLLYRKLRTATLEADVATAPTTIVVANTITSSLPSTCAFDVCLVSTTRAAFAWNQSDGLSYVWGTITGSTPTIATYSKADQTDGPIAICATPDATAVMIVRTDNRPGPTTPSIRYDLLTVATGAVVRLDQTIENNATTYDLPAAQIACAFNDVSIGGGEYVASVWWSSYNLTTNPLALSSGTTRYATVQQVSGTVSTPIVFANTLAVASRAFCRTGTGHVYVNLVFSEDNRIDDGLTAQLQDTYFLYRDDGRLCGQIAPDVAGGFEHDTVYQSIVGHLPNVSRVRSLDKYAWCAQRRRRIQLAQTFDSAYSARSPLDAVISFDDNRARRAVRLGETLYITGSEVLQYDGQQLVELGFHIYPWRLGMLPFIGLGGVIPPGKYTYKSTCRWDNARGERERSTTAAYNTLDESGAGGNFFNTVIMPTLGVTHKTSARSPVVLELWRTKANPGSLEDPMYLATSLDPRNSSTSTNNRFVANVTPGAASINVTDNLTDAVIATNEENEEVGAVLEALAPPPCTIIAASQDRIFIAGVAGDPHRVWYSKLRATGRVAAFDDALTIDIPHPGGDITALAIMAETLVVFRESAIYLVPGEGFSDTGEGQNYGPARVVSPDTGAISAECVTLTALGLVFKSEKGWYLLPPSSVPQFIGAPISIYDTETVLATNVVESAHQVRIVSASRILVWDYLVNQWSEWTESSATTACVWLGQHVWWSANANDWCAEQLVAAGSPVDYSGAAYGIDVELPWVKLNDLAGRGRVRRILITGEFRSAHRVRIRVARDYAYNADGSVAWFDDVLWSPTTAVANNVEQMRHGPSIQRCEALKVRITVVGAASAPGAIVPAVAGEGMRLTGIALEVGVEPGVNINLSAAQKG